LAIVMTLVTILLLAALHLLSPEFSPSWRMISEYALGHYAWVLSLMFLSWGIGSWALVVAIWPEVDTGAGKVGLWFLFIAGIGEAMASVFDVTHEVGHGIAGLLGVIGFPIAALLLSVALGRNESWRTARRPLLWLANLSWISVVLLMLTLAIMTMQMIRINGGHLPQHAPRSLHRECLPWTGGRTASSCYSTVRGYLLLPGMRFSYGVRIPKVCRVADESAIHSRFQSDTLIPTLRNRHRSSGRWSAIRK
jgi:hypothetical protein